MSRKISCFTWPLREHPPWQVCSQHYRPREKWRAGQRRNHSNILELSWDRIKSYLRKVLYIYKTLLWQTGILLNPQWVLMQLALKWDRAVHNRSRWVSRSKYKYAIVCNNKKGIVKFCLCNVDKICFDIMLLLMKPSFITLPLIIHSKESETN